MRCRLGDSRSERRTFLWRVMGCAAGALTLGCLASLEAVASESAGPAQGTERRYPLPEGTA